MDDTQAWVFPPSGANDNPFALKDKFPTIPSASFGPVRKGDSIELRWTPADTTPTIIFWYWDGP